MQLVSGAVGDRTLVRLSLAAPLEAEPGLRRIRVRPVLLRAGYRLQFVWERATQDLTQNLDPVDGLARLGDWLGTSFAMGTVVTTSRTATVDLRRAGRPHLEVRAVSTPPAEASHDRPKERAVDSTQRWLQVLGVTTAEGRVCRGMEAKFRQIHRFVELLDPLLVAAGLKGEGTSAPADGEPLRLVDMGCGKGYLTFAAHEHLGRESGRPVRTRGVEVRPELVEAANRHARECGMEGLEFVAGAITDQVTGPADVLVALHACDTATDDALAAGIAAGARLLVVAPCCHREVRPQLRPPRVLEPVLRHGILRERQAEFVTDALRSLLLETAGYEPRVFEFISPEHTAKNLMIAAVRRPSGPEHRERAVGRVRELAGAYGIRRQRLAEHLGVGLEDPARVGEAFS